MGVLKNAATAAVETGGSLSPINKITKNWIVDVACFN